MHTLIHTLSFTLSHTHFIHTLKHTLIHTLNVYTLFTLAHTLTHSLTHSHPCLPTPHHLQHHSIIGVPKNLKHAILSLPHAYAPRLDAAVHLRCQFRHFEQLVGPDDGEKWIEAQKEQNDWLNSTDR